MPNPPPKDPKNPTKVPQRRDRGPGIEEEHERELEDRVGRTSDEPEMVPPGQTVRRTGEGDIEHDRGPGTDDEAMTADRDAQKTSDRRDGRDGVDASDTIGNDPDTGGKPRRRR